MQDYSDNTVHCEPGRMFTVQTTTQEWVRWMNFSKSEWANNLHVVLIKKNGLTFVLCDVVREIPHKPKGTGAPTAIRVVKATPVLNILTVDANGEVYAPSNTATGS